MDGQQVVVGYSQVQAHHQQQKQQHHQYTSSGGSGQNSGNGGGAAGLHNRNNNNNNGGGGNNNNNDQDNGPSPSYQVANGGDVLADYMGTDFDSRWYGNIVNFTHTATPKVSSSRCVYRSNGEVQCSLGDVWKSLRFPYGASVHLEKPAYLNPLKGADRAVYYAPLLSGLNLTFTPGLSSERRKEYLKPQLGGLPLVGRDIRLAIPDCTTGMHWYEDQKPELRIPMFDRMRTLSQTNFSGLLSAKSTDFTPTSWFAVLWQPVFCQNHTPKRSAGSFLVFYLVRPNPSIHQMTALPMDSGGIPSPVFRCDRLSVDSFWTDGDNMTLPIGRDEAKGDVGGEGMGACGSSSATGEETSQPSTSLNHTSGSQNEGDGSQSTEPHSATAAPTAGATAEGTAGVTSSSNSLGRAESSGGLQHLETGSRGSSDGAVPPHCIPICGIVPLRVRPDVWFNQVNDISTGFSHIAPLFLVVSAMQLMRTSDSWVSRCMEDYYFFMKHERFLGDLLRLAG